MASLNPRRLTGRALRASVKAARMPLIGSGVRAAGRPLLGLDLLRDARFGQTHPYLAPPVHSGPFHQSGQADDEASRA